MVVAAAVIAVALVGAPDAPQASADQSVPYTLSGVRRVAEASEPPLDQPETVSEVEPPLRPARPPQLNVAAWSTPPPVTLPRDDRLVTPCLAPAGPAWHREFLAMTVPAYAASEFDLMRSGERAFGAGTSLLFGTAFDGIDRLWRQWRSDARARALENLRRQIDRETSEVERLDEAGRAGRRTDPDASGAAGRPAFSEDPAAVRNH